ncbi:MAG TPA: DMT family transporter [Clostridia bacterium]|nr:DMT family transporter [Clostridia bacterium]
MIVEVMVIFMLKNLYPKLQALLAAVLFGVSAPISKLLLNDVEPVLLASLLYLGCGFGLLIAGMIRKAIIKNIEKEASLVKKDIPWLTVAILAGGVAAPVILMISLKNTPAATASLLLNFEAVATSIIAAAAFKETLGKRVWSAVALITLASIILTWDASGNWGFSAGAAGVILACFFWGIDNNFTRNISAKNPLTIVTIKGIAAGAVSLMIALAAGSSMPGPGTFAAALLLGFISYGTSIVLFILSMRSLGAARASAFFGSAPFVGALISLILFMEQPGFNFVLSIPFMAAGAYLILKENHSHAHRHERIEHEHRHSHDDGHHTHTHEEGQNGEHSHLHVHEEMVHTHAHTPDTFHRHTH